jgi:hypothetical protein
MIRVVVVSLTLTFAGVALAQEPAPSPSPEGAEPPVLRSIPPPPPPTPTPKPSPPPPVVLPAPTPATAPLNPIQHAYLNPDAACLVRCQNNMVTTVQFPDPIQIMDGKGFARTPEETKAKDALFVLSHVPNSNVLSVNPLAQDVASNLNVVMDGEVYVLVFVSQAQGGFYKVKLQQRPVPAGPPPGAYGQKRDLTPSPDKLISTIDLCKAYHLVKEQHPELVEDLVTVFPDSVTNNDGFTIRNLGVYRKDRFDALVFECLLVNSTEKVIYYDPKSFAARIGSLVYHVAVPDASGQIPAHGKTSAWFLFQGDDYGGSGNLDPRNDFQLSLKRTPGPVAPSTTAAQPVSATQDDGKTTIPR